MFGARLPLWAPRGEAAHRQLPQATVIPLRGAKGQQAALPLALGGRFFPRIQRHTQRFRDLYRARAAVEREFGRLKHDYGLAPLRVRGLDAEHVRATLAGVLAPERVVGVETGSCPHTAVRDDPSMNLDAVSQLRRRFPDGDVVLVESGGDNLTLTFSRALADYFVFVIDVAEGDKIPRKRGPGITDSDLLVINKIDLAPHVRADLQVMERDARAARRERPFLFTNCFTGEGLDEVVHRLEPVVARWAAAA